MQPLSANDPRVVGPYRLLGRLGGGGMGRVFLGRSPGGLAVAVKVVRDDLAQDALFRERFAREVEAARLVGGFYTAQVVDADPQAEVPWMATAYIAGPTLGEAVLRHGPMSARALGVLGAGLAEGLAAIHSHGLVHRDLKPGNVVLAADGPRVIDFGIARALYAARSHMSRSVVMGTPPFMSPEQILGAGVEAASDVFSLGAVLVYAATGHSPFGDSPTEAVVYRIVHGEADLAAVPPAFAPLLGACLEKEAARRDSGGSGVPARPAWAMMFGQARSRSVLMGLDNHMITGTVPALRPGKQPSPERDMTSHHKTGEPDRSRTCNAPDFQGPHVRYITEAPEI